MRDSNPVNQTEWIAVKNISSTPAPPYAVLQIVRVDDEGLVNVQQPNANCLDPAGLLINNAFTLPPEAAGQAHRSYPCAVIYESADDVLSVGTHLGTKAGDWKLRRGYSGFVALSDGSNDVVNVRIQDGPALCSDAGSGSGSGDSDGSGSGSGSDIPPGCRQTLVTNVCVSPAGSGSGCCPVTVEKTTFNTCVTPWEVVDQWCETDPAITNCCSGNTGGGDQPDGPGDGEVPNDCASNPFLASLGWNSTPILPTVPGAAFYTFTPTLSGTHYIRFGTRCGGPAGLASLFGYGCAGAYAALPLSTFSSLVSDCGGGTFGPHCDTAVLTAGVTYGFFVQNDDVDDSGWFAFEIGLGTCP